MGDVFKEQLVKKKKSGKDIIIKAGMVFIAVIFIAAALLLIPSFSALIIFAAGFGVYYGFSMLNLEYEYIFTNGDLDIDCIFNKSRRKRIFSGDTGKIEMMVHIGEKGYEADFKKAIVKKDCSSGDYGNNTYKFIVNYQNKYLQIIFEPNDSLLQAMSPYLGQRRLIRKK